MEFKKIAIIGAGIMGRDIALDCALHGYEVVLKDIHEEVLHLAKRKIKENYRLVKMMKKDSVQISSEEVFSRIHFTTAYDEFQEADLVIENIIEDYTEKENLYKELNTVCADSTVFGVNTSCISITRIGALMNKPENVIGMHFMNPVFLKNFVEVIRGYHTSDATVSTIQQFLDTLDKTCSVVNDLPGFVSNRVMMPMINECIWALQDGVAEPKDLDRVFRLGFSHAMGPLATADLIGLDTILNSLMVLYESYNDSKYRPCPLLKKMVDAGLLGRKSGCGFFDYQ